MRPHCGLYADAGYLLAATATRIAGTSLRSSIDTDYEQLIDVLSAHATEQSGLPLLRVYWYDAARGGLPSPEQEKVGLLPRVKVRLGRVGVDGEQKGVDLRIGLDLVAHARNGVVDVIYLVSGDDDLTEAVEEAQAHGVQVLVLAAPNADGDPHGVSRHLQGAADGLDLLSATLLDKAVTRRSAHGQTVPSVPAPTGNPTPTPSVLAGRKPTTPLPHLPSGTAQIDPRGAGTLVYSSGPDGASTIGSLAPPVEDVAETIGRVVDRVLTTWLAGDGDDKLGELMILQPSIPRDVDRALLRDLSDALGTYDLTDTTRHELRAHFWDKVREQQAPS